MKESPLVVVGSGIAGLLVARLVAESRPVQLFTKLTLFDSNTDQAQGGIAAVWSEKDSVALHSKDTMAAGAGLCDPAAVQVLAEESRKAIEQLIHFGTNFDLDDQQKPVLGLEGAHSVHRILHAGGDATGHEIQRALVESVVHHSNIQIHEHTLVTEILTRHGAVSGVRYYHVPGRTNHTLDCSQVVIATGGAGQLYKNTSNPDCATGDGVVLAHRVGALVEDLEFYQFHPTALSLPNCPNFLITEAMRGEGAILRNNQGEAFMADQHPQQDLAPRDIVSRAIAHQMAEQQGAPVFLDSTHLDSDMLPNRFPTIFKKCLEHGIDIRRDLIPVTPVAHYMIGGITTDLSARTTFPGLYACGEVARTGVHGANRLASNSLLEAAVFGMRVSKKIKTDQYLSVEQWPHKMPVTAMTFAPTVPHASPGSMGKKAFRKSMWEMVGLIRNEFSLKRMQQLLAHCPLPNPRPISQADFELETMKVLGRLMAESALERRESKGAHFRSDYPGTRSVVEAVDNSSAVRKPLAQRKQWIGE